MSGDLVGVLEAAYQQTESEDAWLHGLLEATLPFALTPGGVNGFFFDVGATGAAPRFWGERGIGRDAEKVAKMLAAANGAAPPELLRQLYYEGPRVASGSEQVGGAAVWQVLPSARMLRQIGVTDVVGIRATDVTGVGVLFGWSLAAVRNATPRERHVWGRISSHVTTALRLRRLRREATDSPAAVLTSSGRCEHAEGAAVGARDSLRDAVKSRERARGKVRRTDPTEALEAWRALVQGRWSIVDHFDSDGRRYIVAHENRPQPRPFEALGERELQVTALAAMGLANKAIGYEFGLATSTVASHLSSAARRLGADKRTSLIAMYRASGRASGPTS